LQDSACGASMMRHFSTDYYMRPRYIFALLLCVLLCPSIPGYCQSGAGTALASQDAERIASIRRRLDRIVEEFPVYGEEVTLSVGRMNLSELLRYIAQLKNVNLSVRDDFDCTVSCSFANSRIDDLLVFLCREYKLDIDTYGNIVSITGFAPAPPPYVPVQMEMRDSLLSFDFTDKQLDDVASRISYLSGENIIVPSSLKQSPVSARAVNSTVKDALTMISAANDMDIFEVKGDEHIWCFASRGFEGEQPQGRRQRGIGSFGNQNDTTFIIGLTHRSMSNVRELIPEELSSNLRIIEAPELNALIVHGEYGRAYAVEEFLKRIDVKIPLIEIDVMMIESTKSMERKIGAELGAKSEKTYTTGSVGSGVDVTLGAENTLSLLNKINGFSTIKLGDVSDKIFLDLKLLEEDGLVNIESTPKLATLNGHETILQKGGTTFYKEINTSYIGSQTPLQTTSYVWKEVEANLRISITPHVSRDSLITLKIDLQQKEFNDKVAIDIPPDMSNRSFQSSVVVNDGDVVLLGGIDSKSYKNTANGLPWIAKVPVLRWFLGKEHKKTAESKLNILIRATLI